MGISNVASNLKVCKFCNKEQPITNYTIRSNGFIASKCKSCNAEYSRLYRINNREKYLETKRKHRQKIKEQNSVQIIRQNWDNLTTEEKDKYKCGIYCITIGERFYIGSCVNFASRIKDHTRKLGYGTHVNKKMQSVFDKYQKFEAEIIEHCSPEQLDELEQKYINQWFDDKRCMNLRPEVKTMFGFKHSEESKRKMVESRKKYLAKKNSNGHQ